jgi:PASTA domain
MAKLFQVNLPDGLSNVKLDSQGRATVQYTVKNVSARSIDGRAVLISLPQVRPPSGPVEKGWVKIDGNTDQHFDVDKEQTFTVKIAVPPNSPQGSYTFRLDTVWVDQPDQGDAGGAVAFTVATPPKPNGHFPLWLIPVIAVVVIGIAVGIYFAVSSGGAKVPDLTGVTADAAKTAVEGVGMTLDSKTVASTPDNAGKVFSQSPAAGQKATKGGTVEVQVGASAKVNPGPTQPVTTTKTYRSPGELSGPCENFSPPYTLCSEQEAADWKIVGEPSFQLFGDRTACGKWSRCNQTVRTATRVCWQFELQGHSEQCTPLNRTGGKKTSEGQLTVTWQHPAK